MIGASGGGRYARSCGSALAERLRRVAVVSSTASSDFPGVRQTWSIQDRRLYTTAAKAPWILWAWMAKTTRDLRREPGRMLRLLPRMSSPDERAVQRAGVRAVIRAMSTEAFRWAAAASPECRRTACAARPVPGDCDESVCYRLGQGDLFWTSPSPRSPASPNLAAARTATGHPARQPGDPHHAHEWALAKILAGSAIAVRGAGNPRPASYRRLPPPLVPANSSRALSAAPRMNAATMAVSARFQDRPSQGSCSSRRI